MDGADDVMAPAHGEAQRARQRVAVPPLSLALLMGRGWVLLRVARKQTALAASRGMLHTALDATADGLLISRPVATWPC